MSKTKTEASPAPSGVGYLLRSGERMLVKTCGAVTAGDLAAWLKGVREGLMGEALAEAEEAIASRPDTGGTAANKAVVEMVLDVLRAYA